MDGDFELEKIRQEIQQEKQMKEMLEQSAAELRATVEELENRYDTVDNEGNEWKTRYETQTEINEQLERQILNLQNKVQEAKSNLKDDENLNESSSVQQRKKTNSLESKPFPQKQQKIKSIEKTNNTAVKDDFFPDGRVRPYRRTVRHRTDVNTNNVPQYCNPVRKPLYIRTRAGRNIQSRSSMMSNSIQGSGSIVDSKPGSATTKSTGIEINIAFSPREAGKTPRDMNRFDDLSDANPHMIRMLEKEKQMLSSQLRDLEWRLDQESKAYHKANDERKTYNLEINTTKHQHGEMSSRQRAMGSREQLDTISGSRTPRDLSRPSYQTKSSGTNSSSNIPEDQRIIDPKEGQLKRQLE